MNVRIFVGYDSREPLACAITCRSVARHTAVPVERLVLADLRAAGLYTRPTEMRDGRLWDVISGAPMSTEFALSRFWLPLLCDWQGWALFMDGDMLVRHALTGLFDLRDETKAVMCVQHVDLPVGSEKMRGQAQTAYARKNWSSLMLINCAHPANRALTPEMLNTLPGRELHRFCWLRQEEIGALPDAWNHLVRRDPAIVHFTEGVPTLPGFEDSAFGDEWNAVAGELARQDIAEAADG